MGEKIILVIISTKKYLIFLFAKYENFTLLWGPSFMWEEGACIYGTPRVYNNFPYWILYLWWFFFFFEIIPVMILSANKWEKSSSATIYFWCSVPNEYSCPCKIVEPKFLTSKICDGYNLQVLFYSSHINLITERGWEETNHN